MSKRRGVTEYLSVFESIGATFFDLETDLLVVLDEQGSIYRVNNAFERELERPEQSVFKSELIRLIHEDDLAAFIHSFDGAMKPEPVRMLKWGGGEITVKLVAYKFKRTDEGLRGFLIFRKAY